MRAAAADRCVKDVKDVERQRRTGVTFEPCMSCMYVMYVTQSIARKEDVQTTDSGEYDQLREMAAEIDAEAHGLANIGVCSVCLRSLYRS